MVIESTNNPILVHTILMLQWILFAYSLFYDFCKFCLLLSADRSYLTSIAFGISPVNTLSL